MSLPQVKNLATLALTLAISTAGGGLATTTPARIAAAMRLSKRQRATIEQLRRIIPGASPPRLVLGVMRWQ